jgi:hypothetical protein
MRKVSTKYRQRGRHTLACGTALAGQLAKAPPPKAALKQSSVVFQGVQVAIDPRAGLLREPTAAERKAPSKAMLQRQALEAVTPQARATPAHRSGGAGRLRATTAKSAS